MTIKKEFPPNYEKIKQVLNPPPTAIFCFGDILYNPTGATIYEDIMEHEEVHERQMEGKDALEWWDKYLEDKEFRKECELEAYSVQYNWIVETRNAKMAKKYLELFAKQLSGLYNIDMTEKQAYTAIRLLSKKCKNTSTVA